MNENDIPKLILMDEGRHVSFCTEITKEQFLNVYHNFTIQVISNTIEEWKHLL